MGNLGWAMNRREATTTILVVRLLISRDVKDDIHEAVVYVIFKGAF